MTVVFAGVREHVKDSRSFRLDFEKEGIRVINVQADSRYDSLFVRKVERVLHSERPDILHTHLPRADFAGGFARSFDPNTIWVCSVRDLWRGLVGTMDPHRFSDSVCCLGYPPWKTTA